MHQGAAVLHDFQWGPNPTEVQLVNSIGVVTVMVLLTVDTIVSSCSLSSATFRSRLVILSLWWGRLCTYCRATLALYFPPASKTEQVLGSTAALLWATIMASHVTYQVVFLVRNHSCKIDFSHHTSTCCPSILHTIFLYIIWNKMKKVSDFLIDWIYI